MLCVYFNCACVVSECLPCLCMCALFAIIVHGPLTSLSCVQSLQSHCAKVDAQDDSDEREKISHTRWKCDNEDKIIKKDDEETREGGMQRRRRAEMGDEACLLTVWSWMGTRTFQCWQMQTLYDKQLDQILSPFCSSASCLLLWMSCRVTANPRERLPEPLGVKGAL